MRQTRSSSSRWVMALLVAEGDINSVPRSMVTCEATSRVTPLKPRQDRGHLQRLAEVQRGERAGSASPVSLQCTKATGLRSLLPAERDALAAHGEVVDSQLDAWRTISPVAASSPLTGSMLPRISALSSE